MKKYSLFLTILIFLLIVPLSASGEVFYVDTDNVGSPVAMWDSQGKKVWDGEYLPFGEEFRTTESPQVNKNRFVGKEKDKETGLTYFGARYFDERSGRFLTPDPVRVVDPFTSRTNYELLENPQRLNRYAYGLNNPYKYIDPDGEFAILIPFAPAAVAGFSKTAAYATAFAVGAYGGQKIWDHVFAAKPDFIGQPDGVVVDIKATPQGAYDQPDGGRTDVLQKEDHGAGQSHTHDPIVNVNKKTGEKFVNSKSKPGRAVSANDVKNIKSGKARPSKPKKR